MANATTYKLEWNQAEFERSLKQAVTAEVASAGDQVVSQAKSIVPVKTGKLRDSISASNKQQGNLIQSEVVADTDYAAEVELGSSGRTPKPYLRPSLDLAVPKLTAALQNMRLK